MANYGICYNGSGYVDPTAYKAIMGAAKPGDIWTEGGNLVLILKNQGAYCNALTLRETNVHSRMMEVVSGKTFYTDPGMLKYVFCERLGQYCQRLPKDEFARVLREVVIALDFGGDEKKISREKYHKVLDKILDEAGEA